MSFDLDLARKMGATRAIDVKHQQLNEVMDILGMREGFDVGLEMSGNPIGFKRYDESNESWWTYCVAGFPPRETAIDWSHVIFKGLDVKGIYGREMFETWYKMIACYKVD